MRVLIIHPEPDYFAGAERMLEYFLSGLGATDCQPTVALVPGSRVEKIVPDMVDRIAIAGNARFSPIGLYQQLKTLAKFRKQFPYALIHAWAARGWELSSLLGKRTGIPAVGTLHDHPRARFITAKRQRLMRLCAKWGLARVVCVSDAVREGCAKAGYPAGNLITIHNGLPLCTDVKRPRTDSTVRLGFLGVFSERKGIKGLFQMVDRLNPSQNQSWSLEVAGGAYDKAGKLIVQEICNQYSQRPWWPRVKWIGWLERPVEFLNSLDLLICPSTDFDPFPTVLLEAGQAGTAVLAAKVGGVPEIVDDQLTGWLFEPNDWSNAASILARLLASPPSLAKAGEAARRRVETCFTANKMVADYLELYSTLLPNGQRHIA